MLTTYHFNVLHIPVTLRGPDTVLAPIVRSYGRFLSQDPPPGDSHEIRIESTRAESFTDGAEVVPVIRGGNLTLQIYERFLTAVFDRVSTHAVLHAAALVDARGDALLIAGPSGFGKTSLTLELLCRDFRFLSDDYAPIDLSTARVEPYPRTVGLLPDGTVRLPPRFIDAAADPTHPRMLGKVLIDVGEVLGDAVVADEAARLGHVVILESGDGAEPYRSVVHLGIWPRGREGAGTLLRSIPGAELLGQDDRDDISILRIRLDHGRLPPEHFSELLERDFVAFSETSPGVPADFRSTPNLAPLKRREAAVLLCREVQNRRRRGRLMQAYEGDTTRLFLDVAAALASARCFRLRVGDFETMANHVEGLTR